MRLFAMDIEPQKEIVLTISQVENTEKIVQSIRDELHIDEPGKGIMFVQDVTYAYGLF
jgi:nitrogen regulatory protein PII